MNRVRGKKRNASQQLPPVAEHGQVAPRLRLNDTMTELMWHMGVSVLNDNSENNDRLSTEDVVQNFAVDQNSEDNNFIVRKRCRNEIRLGEDLFSTLSDEIILLVFRWLPRQFLGRCAQVCHRWKRLAFDDDLWRRVDLAGKCVKNGTIGQLLHRGVMVLRLASATISSPTCLSCPYSTSPLCTCNRTSTLQYLDLSMAGVSVTTLNEILAMCSRLKKLSLEHCNLDDETCRHIGENPNLEALNLALSEGLTYAGSYLIVTKCPNIKDLNLSWTDLDSHTFGNLVSRLPRTLESLNLAGFRTFTKDSVISSVLEQCPNLIELDISDSPLLTSSVLAHLSQFKYLQRLSLSRCNHIFTNTFTSDLKEFPALQYLNMFRTVSPLDLKTITNELKVQINQHRFSTVARPTTGIRCTSIWGLSVRC